MARHRRLLERAVVHPVEIRLSLMDADCRLCFAPGPRRRVMILVVGDVVERFVKTAHLVRRPGGGRIEWSRPTR
jgi:hypothetical protein